MFLENFQNSMLVESLAWTLFHSVWQIGLIAFCLFLALKFVAKSNANLRYLLAISALSFTLILPVSTFFYESQISIFGNNSQVNSVITAKNSQQNLVEDEEFYVASETLASSSKSIEKIASANTWQKSLETSFSAYSPYFVAFWLIGMLFYSLRLFGGFWQLHRYKTQEVSKPKLEWQVKFIELCEKLNVRQNVELLQSNLVKSPMVIGWIKPVILVPTSVFFQMNPSQLETIIAHELMHIRRFDYLVNFAQSFVEILFFYHPCVWWISAKIRQERECACDDAVLQTFENAQFTYANALANLEAFRLNAKQNEPQLNVAANGGKLMNRIERIVKKETKINRFQNSLWSASLVSMLILAFMVTVFWANSSPDVNQKTNWNYNSERKMAVGFVAIPPSYKSKVDKDFNETANLLIEKLKKNKVPAVGFVQGSRLVNIQYRNSVKTNRFKINSSKVDILRTWRDAGLEIGVGNFGHMRFYESGFDEYVTELRNNIDLIKPILSETNQELRYFSYPYLNTGKDITSKIRFEAWLAENDLQFIPYTFDNQEWMYSYAYDKARKQKNVKMMVQVKQEFLEYMKKMVIHYEGYSNDLFYREIPQTLVLTTSRLVADSSDELFGIFKNRGYEFVSMDEALKDEAYHQSENFVGRAGISWMERWTMTRGKKLRKEPKVSEGVNNVWKNRKQAKTSATPPPPPPTAPPVPNFTIPPKPPKPPKPSKGDSKLIRHSKAPSALKAPIKPKAPKPAPPKPPKPFTF